MPQRSTARKALPPPTHTNPTKLPQWEPSVGTPIAVTPSYYPPPEMLSDEEKLEELLSRRPLDQHERQQHAVDTREMLGKLRRADRFIYTAIGRIACMVEEYTLWRLYPGCENFAQFFEDNDWRWPLETVKAAMALHRNAVPLAERIGFDLGAESDKLSTVKAQELTKLSKPYRQTTEIPEEEQEQLREQLSKILNTRDSDLLSSRRQKKGEPERVQIVVRVQLVKKGRDFVARVVDTDMTKDQIDALVERRGYFQYDLGGEIYQLEQLAEELRRLTAARNVRQEPTLTVE
jgi:hypothetical protein